MHYLVIATLLVTGVIHLLPLTGVLGGLHLRRLYGIGDMTPDLDLLLRHRAVLFGLLGAFLLYAAFKPSLQTVALIGALTSVGTFVILGWREGLSSEINRVFWIDVALIVPLTVALGYSIARSL